MPGVPTTEVTEKGLVEEPQVVVVEATNSLLVNATPQQHERIAAIIKHVDVEARKETLPFEIYFLENQEPEQLATVLGKLIQETITGADGKIEQAWYKISPKDTPVKLQQALAAS